MTSTKLIPALVVMTMTISSIAMGQTSVVQVAQPITATIGDTQQAATPAPATPAPGESYFDSSCSAQCDDLGNGIFGRGIIKKSDHRFDRFVSPITNPVYFEDPRQNTELRGLFLQHRVPLAAGGNDVQLYALQIRARLSDNVSLIAVKDGYITSSNPIIQNGWADTALGLKFSLIRDAERQRLLSAGFTYELASGEASAQQGNGQGELNLFTTGGRQIGCRAHWLTAFGARIPINPTDESSSIYWSNHLDYQILRRSYLVTELNWFHWTKSGQDGPIPGIEGLDLFNFGNPNVTGNDILTGAIGTKFKPNRHNEFGFGFEFPLTNRRDIIDNRITVDWIVRY